MQGGGETIKKRKEENGRKNQRQTDAARWHDGVIDTSGRHASALGVGRQREQRTAAAGIGWGMRRLRLLGPAHAQTQTHNSNTER